MGFDLSAEGEAINIYVLELAAAGVFDQAGIEVKFICAAPDQLVGFRVDNIYLYGLDLSRITANRDAHTSA